MRHRAAAGADGFAPPPRPGYAARRVAPVSNRLSLHRLLASGASIEALALAYARDAYPGLDDEPTLRALKSMGDVLAPRLSRLTTDDDRAQVLLEHVYDELGFRGDEASYHDPRNSYLPQVLERRLGIPITLACVLIAVGRRAELPVEGIGFPGHFLARVGATLIDPFEGTVLDQRALSRLARRTLGTEDVKAEHLVAADTKGMLVRMLLNLKHAYERRSDHAQALVVADRLVDLTSSIVHRRDRGLHALALGAHQSAASDLEAYLAELPNPPDGAEVRRALARARSSPPVLS